MIRSGSTVPFYLAKVCGAGVPPNTFVLMEPTRFGLIIFDLIRDWEQADTAALFASNCRSIGFFLVLFLFN